MIAFPLGTPLHFQSRKFRPSPRQMWSAFWGIMKRFLAVLLIVTGTIVSATSAYADNTKISPELRNLPSNQQAQVIVQYAPGTQLTCTGLLGLLDCVLNDVVQLGGTILGQLPLVNGLVANSMAMVSSASRTSQMLSTSAPTAHWRLRTPMLTSPSTRNSLGNRAIAELELA